MTCTSCKRVIPADQDAYPNAVINGGGLICRKCRNVRRALLVGVVAFLLLYWYVQKRPW